MDQHQLTQDRDWGSTPTLHICADKQKSSGNEKELMEKWVRNERELIRVEQEFTVNEEKISVTQKVNCYFLLLISASSSSRHVTRWVFALTLSSHVSR